LSPTMPLFGKNRFPCPCPWMEIQAGPMTFLFTLSQTSP
jgi:hypothetical protein